MHHQFLRCVHHIIFHSLLEKEAAFAVTKPITDDNGEKIDTIICYVTLTSTSLRKKLDDENVAAADDEEKEIKEEEEIKQEIVEEKPEIKPEIVVDEKDLLSKDKCLAALAELRHARWFAAMAANLPSCVECIRIMKDLVRRDPVWSSLSDWTIELLVERSLYSAWRPLNPAASLMRVMEVIYLFFYTTYIF